ncbi:MAG: hypothetical protein GXC76_00005 [Rhodanobacteraceae bacterium]|jgi:hypothetical protein|nr:hypothetical protein [Rhodanobacteraceae bacterium]
MIRICDEDSARFVGKLGTNPEQRHLRTEVSGGTATTLKYHGLKWAAGRFNGSLAFPVVDFYPGIG